jgi:hypothetical protein
MTSVKSAHTPLGRWQYFPALGLNVLDTDGKGDHWRPLIVSIALTGLCYKSCSFCYASSTKAGTSAWGYAELVDFIMDLDRNGVFSVTLGGGEPTLWEDPHTGKNFYDLVSTLFGRVSLTLTFTTSGIPRLRVEQLPDMPLRLSCHHPAETLPIIERAETYRKTLSQVGINLLLWRSRLDECRQAITQFLAAGFNDILLLTMLPAGFGVDFAVEALHEQEVAAFIQSLGVNSVRLTGCQKPPSISVSADMGCGANDWFVAITEAKKVKSCSFVDQGHPLTEPTYQALLAATANLPRLPCYRSYRTAPVGQLAYATRTT